MTPLVIVLGAAGSGRTDVVRELIEVGWPDASCVRVLRESREGGEAGWKFADGRATLPEPADEDA
ncbi:MAG: hypothetical protein FJ410_00005, partial [Verrucomicrobia bacterium]|nr:hypothetical protein [Verrucomicrobiota bacterium]